MDYFNRIFWIFRVTGMNCDGKKGLEIYLNFVPRVPEPVLANLYTRVNSFALIDAHSNCHTVPCHALCMLNS